MAVRNDTILAALYSERDRIQEILNADRKPLEATLTAVQHMIAIYEARATESVKDRLPATLKAAKKIRSENSNGNGQQPHVTKKQQRIANMIATLRNPTSGRNLTIYVNNGYLRKAAAGGYAITAKGKQKLTELTGSDAPTP